MPAIDIRQGRVRPSRWWYLLVPLVLAAGAAMGIANAVDEWRQASGSFRLLDADGGGSIGLAAGEQATVWAVWQDGRTTEDVQRPRADVHITGPDGAATRFDAAASRTTWSFGSDTGIDLGTFVAPIDGSYLVDVDFPGRAGGAVPRAAVGKVDISGALARVYRPVLASIAAAFVVLALLVLARRSSRRRIAGHGRAAVNDGGSGSDDAPPGEPSQRPTGPISFE